MCHNSEKSGKKVKYLMARKVENFTYLMNAEVIRAQCRCHSNIWMCLFLPATQAIVSGHLKNLCLLYKTAPTKFHMCYGLQDHPNPLDLLYRIAITASAATDMV